MADLVLWADSQGLKCECVYMGGCYVLWWRLQSTCGSAHTGSRPFTDCCAAIRPSCAVLCCAVGAVCVCSRQAALSTDPIPTIGLRRPLGSDVRRRRYWVLGGGAGAWRVYCEEGDSSNWVSGAASCTQCCTGNAHPADSVYLVG